MFLSPPWGGPSYLSYASPRKAAETAASTTPDEVDSQPSYSLSNILPVPGKELFALTRALTRNVAFFLPRNVDLGEVSELVKVGEDGMTSTQREKTEMVEVEEEYMGGKLKAVTCYFGGLVAGQEGLF